MISSLNNYNEQCQEYPCNNVVLDGLIYSTKNMPLCAVLWCSDIVCRPTLSSVRCSSLPWCTSWMNYWVLWSHPSCSTSCWGTRAQRLLTFWEISLSKFQVQHNYYSHVHLIGLLLIRISGNECKHYITANSCLEITINMSQVVNC